MKVRLLRQARITVKAGEIVEISPAEAAFLVSVQSAVYVACGEKNARRSGQIDGKQEKGVKNEITHRRPVR